MEGNNTPYPTIFDSADKRLKFGISNVGEFNDSVYREQASNPFYNKIIGRQLISKNEKNVFTTSDIVCEGYLFKKGSWHKNWKKRYFILRKDIRSLCYYNSREDLILLGSICLDNDIRLVNIKPEDGDGFKNVILIESDEEVQKHYIKFETFEKMKAWMLDIKSEAQSVSFTYADPSLMDWWKVIFGDIQTIEPKAVISKSLEIDTVSTRQHFNSSVSPINNSHISQKLSTFSDLKLAVDIPDSDDESDTDEGSTNSPFLENLVIATKDHSISNALKNRIKNVKVNDKPVPPPPYYILNANCYENGETNTLNTFQFSLKLTNVCNYLDKLFIVVFGSLNANSNSADQDKWIEIFRTETRIIKNKPSYSESFLNEEKIFFHLACPLINEKFDNIKIVLFKHETESKNSSKSSSKSYTNNANLNLQHEIAFTILPRKLMEYKNVLKIRMKVKMLMAMDISIPLYKDVDITLGLIRLTSYSLNFNRKNLFKLFKSVPYNEVVYSFISASGLTQSIEQLFASKYNIHVARGFLQLLGSERHDMMYNQIIKLKKNFIFELENIYIDDSALGLSNNSNNSSNNSKLIEAFEPSNDNNDSDAYMHSPASVSQSVQPSPTSTPSISTSDSIKPNLLTVASGTIEDNTSTVDAFQHSIVNLEGLYYDDADLTSITLNKLTLSALNQLVEGNTLDAEVGGNYLRRSTWKKATLWQYCTTNLNIHLMSSKFYNFHDVKYKQDRNNHQDLFNSPTTKSFINTPSSLHYIPTITLGVPSAHELKFNDGGLRKTFQEVNSSARKLMWILAIQSQCYDLLYSLFTNYSREAYSIFSCNKYEYNSILLALKDLSQPSESRSDSTNSEKSLKSNIHHSSLSKGIILLTKKKLALSSRLDMCCSQALGSALTSIKTIISLATIHGGVYNDVLARNLRCGFLILFQSLLSTQGHEIGMIEDLEIASLWLSLVSVRFVTHSKVKRSDPQTPVRKDTGSPYDYFCSKCDENNNNTFFLGYGDGFTFRRDSNSRIIVDMEVSSQEASNIAQCLDSLSSHPYTTFYDLEKVIEFEKDIPSHFFNAIIHSPSPVTPYYANELKPNVIACCEIVGICFTQGVNEMQTLANLSSSRDVLKQVDINTTSYSRLESYYKNYRQILEHQLIKLLPEMVSYLTLKKNSESIVGSNSTGSDDASITLTVDQLKNKILLYNDRLMDQLNDSIIQSTLNPYDKHVDILNKALIIGRQITSIVSIMCKSGKDRTSMSVTLDTTRVMMEELGVLNGIEITMLVRLYGVRRMNVYANTGQSMFAFNTLQRRALPVCYRPPHGCYAGNVVS